MVDRLHTPSSASNLGHPFQIRWPRKKGGEAVAAKGGAARVSSDMVADWLSEWPFDASKLTVRSRGGRGDDDEAGGVVGEAQES
jgi:hypothetical protein